MVILPDLIGKKITHHFDLVRPLIAFKFQSVSIGGQREMFLSRGSTECGLPLADFKQDEQHIRAGVGGAGARREAKRST
jgi:hypothetical protein